jgi:hypothetical protein
VMIKRYRCDMRKGNEVNKKQNNNSEAPLLGFGD